MQSHHHWNKHIKVFRVVLSMHLCAPKLKDMGKDMVIDNVPTSGALSTQKLSLTDSPMVQP